MGKFLSFEDVKAAEDFRFDEVEVPEWGGTVRVRSLSAGQQSVVSKKYQEKNMAGLEVTLCIMACVDEDGNRIFAERDRDMLRGKSTTAVTRIAERVLAISQPAVSVEEAEKN